jgi:hypothetical protein
MEMLDLSSEPWTTYQILAQLAEKRGRMNEVREWRRKEQESFAAFAGSDTQIKQFEPLIEAIVQAANGVEEATAYLENTYPKMQSGSEDWAKGAQAIQRLVAGERDLSKLTDGLAREIALIIMRALQVLNGEQTVDGGPFDDAQGRQQTVENGQRSTVNGQAQEKQEISFAEFINQLLGAVEVAAQGNSVVGKQVAPVVEQMAKDPDMPIEIHAFARALRDVLYGGRSPKLDDVPDELASAIRGLLGRLKNK